VLELELCWALELELGWLDWVLELDGVLLELGVWLEWVELELGAWLDEVELELGAWLEELAGVLELTGVLLELGAWVEELAGVLLEEAGALDWTLLEFTLEETLLDELAVDELLVFEDWLDELAVELLETVEETWLLLIAEELFSSLELLSKELTDDGSSLELETELETEVWHEVSTKPNKIDTVEKAFNFFIGKIINLLFWELYKNIM